MEKSIKELINKKNKMLSCTDFIGIFSFSIDNTDSVYIYIYIYSLLLWQYVYIIYVFTEGSNES